MGGPAQALSPYSNGEIRERGGGQPVVMLSWFVCPSVSMVTTTKVTGLELTLLEGNIIVITRVPWTLSTQAVEPVYSYISDEK